MVSADPANWTPHVLDGKVDAIVVVGNKMVAGGLFTKVATADDPATPIARSNIFAFDATSGVIDMAFAPVMDGEVESLAVAPDGLHVFAGGRFAKINGVAQKSLAKLRLSDGARIAQPDYIGAYGVDLAHAPAPLHRPLPHPPLRGDPQEVWSE